VTTTCPGCNGPKSKRAELCGNCRKQANALGASVLTHVATPTAPFVPRTAKQNTSYHGRLRSIAQLQKPGIEGNALWDAERKLKKWALKQASILAGRDIRSSTELSELEMERLLEFLGDRIDDLKAGRRVRTG
jgi:hypothetical protein